MENVIYLFSHPKKMVVAKCKKFAPIAGWKCAGKFTDSQKCESEYTSLCESGYKGLGVIASVRMVA